MSRHTDIADALIAMLNAATFSKTFTAARAVAPRYLLEQIQTLTVDVVLTARTVQLVTRGGHRVREYELAIAIQDKLGTGSAAAATLAALDALADEIETALVGTPNMSTARLTALATTNPFDPDLAATLHQFATIITAHYKDVL